MKRSEIAKLLTVVEAAEKSGRRPTEQDVELWLMFAVEGQWESYDAALRAYVTYRSEHPDYPLRPGHITQVLERVRRTGSEEFKRLEEGEAPAWVDEDADPRAYSHWRREQALAQRQRAVDEFARGGRDAPKAIEAGS